MDFFSIVKFSVASLLALIPAFIWGYIFYKKQIGNKCMMMRTFVIGACFVAPLLIYKYLWQFFPWLNAFQYTQPYHNDLIGFSTLGMVPLDVILTFMIVGVIEEVTKLWAVKTTAKKYICSIDDAIEMSIMAALGFAFAENILYFYNIISSRGMEGVFYPFIFRSLFSTFAHIMFSGILGYYYGVAHFASDIVKEQHNEKNWPFLKFFAQLLHFKKETLFHEEKLTQGLLIAVTLHALFNIFLEMNWVFLLVPFLTGGYIYLNYLLEQKEAHKIYCLVEKFSS